MLSKEYRICLPMTVEEYRIAQLYMIQRKSREESSGTGSGVEILINEPYDDGPGGKGQYTHKVYHIGSHLPGWFRAILPKSALMVEEEAWNAYPYTKTIYRCPFIEKFSLEIETKYLDNGGESDNIFNMSKSEYRNTTIDYLDIVIDPISPADYQKEEDPKLYVSEKTGRGPLTDNWREEHSLANGDPTEKRRIMCAYKLCKVEFRYWGMQSKIERFIHDVGLRKTMLRAHRQAWAWQDEYYGLTLEDIRALERETQLALQETMAKALEAEGGGAATAALVLTDSRKNSNDNKNILEGNVDDDNVITSNSRSGSLQENGGILGGSGGSGNSLGTNNNNQMTTTTSTNDLSPCKEHNALKRTSEGKGSLTSMGVNRKQSWSSTRSRISGFSGNLSEWKLGSIEKLQTSSSDEDEFFDAHDGMDDLELEDIQDPSALQQKGLLKSSSMEMISSIASGVNTQDSQDDGTSPLDRRLEEYQRLQSGGSSISATSDASTVILQPQTGGHSMCKTTMLFIVLHGGSIMDSGKDQNLSKSSDVSTLKATLNTVIKAHYPSIHGHVAYRTITCPNICVDTLSLLSNLNPYNFDASTPTLDKAVVTNDNFPLSAIPMFATGSPEYCEAVYSTVVRVNVLYQEFLKSEEGLDFNGQVILLADSVGSIMAYDALCKNNPYLTAPYSAATNTNMYGHTHSGSNEALHETDQSDSDHVTQASSGPQKGQSSGVGTASNQPLDPSNKPVSLSNPDLTVTEPVSSSKQQRQQPQQPYAGGEDGAFHNNNSGGSGGTTPPPPPRVLQSQESIPGSSGGQPSRLHYQDSVSSSYGSGGHHHHRTGGGGALSKHYQQQQQNKPNYRHAISCPASRRTSSGSQSSDLPKFDFDVSDLFMFGSPLALVLAYRKLCQGDCKHIPRTQYLDPLAALIGSQLYSQHTPSLPRPSCHQIYNLFYPSDPCALRLEPLIVEKFKHVPTVKIPRYQNFPLGDGHPVHIVETVHSNLILFNDVQAMPSPACRSESTQSQEYYYERRSSNQSVCSNMSGLWDGTLANVAAVTSRWWGTKRLDYALYCPDALQNFPSIALPYLLHASFWESLDVAAFILRQVVRQDLALASSDSVNPVSSSSFTPVNPREKWLKRRTTIKLRNVAPNHRGNDIIVLEDKPQSVTARFMYGPLDMVTLTGEKVDVHIMKNPPTGEWTYYGTEVTDSNGRVVYNIPASQRLPQGMYPVKLIVRGDHTSVDLYLTVLPPKTESAVFSIDGSFTASVSIMGKDPKVRPGAVDVVRHWQDLGYLIVYLTARPDMQQKKVTAWLAQHNFPHGMVAFMDGLSADPLKQKTNFLKQLVQESNLVICASYGSSKDITVYQNVGIKPDDIYVVGKASKKQYKEAVVLSDGYSAHLADLTSAGGSRPASGNARLFLRKSCFSLPGQHHSGGKSSGSGSKKSVRKTHSMPMRSSNKDIPSVSNLAGGSSGSAPGGRTRTAATAVVGSREVTIGISESGNTLVDANGGGAGNARGASPRGKWVNQPRHDSSHV